MIVSCLCPTYNRAPHYLHLLEEAVESFRRQDYPLEERELLILNDCHGQTLVCETPGVRVVNLSQRIASLGEKFNVMIEMAKGKILLPWEDDDISLPGRITQAVEMIKDRFWWKPPQVWYMEGCRWTIDPNNPDPMTNWIWVDSKLHWKHNVGIRHHASAFWKDLWKHVGGYPPVSGNQDALMDAKFAKVSDPPPAFPNGIPPAQWQYIYRWGVSPNHLSGNSDHEAAWKAEASKPIASGTFEIKPKWYADYEAMCKESLN